MTWVRNGFGPKFRDDYPVGRAVFLERVGAKESALICDCAVVDCKPGKLYIQDLSI